MVSFHTTFKQIQGNWINNRFNISNRQTHIKTSKYFYILVFSLHNVNASAPLCGAKLPRLARGIGGGAERARRAGAIAQPRKARFLALRAKIAPKFFFWHCTANSSYPTLRNFSLAHRL
jgi:hypothetical protein